MSVEAISSSRNSQQTYSQQSVQSTQTRSEISSPSAQPSRASGASDDIELSSAAAEIVDNAETDPVISADEEEATYAEDRELAEEFGIGKNKFLLINGSNADDEIHVMAGENGSVIVDVNGETQTFTKEEASRLFINGGNGNDSIIVDEEVTVGMHINGGKGDDTIYGGSGNDSITDDYGSNTIYGRGGNDTINAAGKDERNFFQRIDDIINGRDYEITNTLDGGDGKDIIVGGAGRDTIYGGDGDDYLEGGAGDDYMSGGNGYDVLYGLSGNDTMYGGAGDDYMDGGLGDDTMNGGTGDDNVIGGKGDDVLKGDSGDDLLVGCSGADTVDGQYGSDKVITDGNDSIQGDDDDPEVQFLETATVPNNFSIKGTEQEVERIASDFEFLANTENGQMMFEEIAKTGHDVKVRNTTEGSSCSSSFTRTWKGWGSDSTINYNTTKISLGGSSTWKDRAPVVSMYHEMCHSYNAARGDMNENFYDQTTGEKVSKNASGSAEGVEWQAVGLDNDHVKANPELLTENSLRALLGYNRRERY